MRSSVIASVLISFIFLTNCRRSHNADTQPVTPTKTVDPVIVMHDAIKDSIDLVLSAFPVNYTGLFARTLRNQPNPTFTNATMNLTFDYDSVHHVSYVNATITDAYGAHNVSCSEIDSLSFTQDSVYVKYDFYRHGTLYIGHFKYNKMTDSMFCSTIEGLSFLYNFAGAKL